MWFMVMVIIKCDVMIYNKNCIFDLCFFPGTELWKPLGFFVRRVIKVSFVMLMKQLLESSKEGGLLLVEPTMWLEGWNKCLPSPLPSPQPLGGERRWRLTSIIKGQWFNRSCLRNEASIKSQKTGFGELLGWWPCGDFGRETCSRRAWKFHASYCPHFPSHLFKHLAIPELYPFIIIR